MSDHTDETTDEQHATRSTDHDTPDDSTVAANAVVASAERESGAGDGNPAYHAIAFPEGPPNAEWTTDQRRAYVLEELERVGHPFAIDHRALADQFDVDPETIYADVGHLATYVNGISEERRDLITETVFQLSITELQAAGDHYDAAKVVQMWTDWIFDRGKQERSAEKREINIQTETDAIRVVTPDGDEVTEEGGW